MPNFSKRKTLKHLAYLAMALPFGSSILNAKYFNKKHKIVIIGGGIGGMLVAKLLRKNSKNLQITIIDKQKEYVYKPNLNEFLLDINRYDKQGEEDLLKIDIKFACNIKNITFINEEAIDIDRDDKIVTTTNNKIDYDVLVMSPGIEYDYESYLPFLSQKDIDTLKRKYPAVYKNNDEYKILKENLLQMMHGNLSGNIIITIPSGKHSCPTAITERASVLASFMLREDIPGKVIILNHREVFAMRGAFKEAWKDDYSGKIEHRSNCRIKNIDLENNIIYYESNDGNSVKKEYEKFAILNLIPKNKAANIIKKSGLKVTSDSFGKVRMNGKSFQAYSDSDIYVVGDVVSHALPPSTKTTIWSAQEAVKEIIAKLSNTSYSLPDKSKAANICYALVGDHPKEAIMVLHDFSWTGSVIKAKGYVPKGTNGKFRSRTTYLAKKKFNKSSREYVFY